MKRSEPPSSSTTLLPTRAASSATARTARTLPGAGQCKCRKIQKCSQSARFLDWIGLGIDLGNAASDQDLSRGKQDSSALAALAFCSCKDVVRWQTTDWWED